MGIKRGDLIVLHVLDDTPQGDVGGVVEALQDFDLYGLQGEFHAGVYYGHPLEGGHHFIRWLIKHGYIKYTPQKYKVVLV